MILRMVTFTRMGATRGMRFHVGISGWRYAPWRSVFYPPSLPHRLELAYASRMMNTIEINGSFYSLQHPRSYRRWHDETPDDFIFAVKGPRFITHMKKLNDIEAPLANFFASGILNLDRKLGPILWQFPERFAFDRDRFGAFFKLLPTSRAAAGTMARASEKRMTGRRTLRSPTNGPLRHAVEIRHSSFETSAFFELLEHFNIALVIADTAGRWPLIERRTADFVYARLHGEKTLYASGYTDGSLERWNHRLRKLSEPQAPGFVYFDNDAKVHAPFDAHYLAELLECVPAGVSMARHPRRRAPPARRIDWAGRLSV